MTLTEIERAIQDMEETETIMKMIRELLDEEFEAGYAKCEADMTQGS